MLAAVVVSIFFEGNMAIARMYNQSQTAAQVLQNYNAQKNRFI